MGIYYIWTAGSVQVSVFLNATSRNVLETSLLLNYKISHLAFIFVANVLVFTEKHPLTEK